MEIIKKYNLITKKKFGQNFLTSENILDKIVAVAGNIENKNILEVGPGPGGLTTSILKQKPKKLISVEIDNDLFNILKVEFNKYNNFEVINEDALKIDESEYFDNNINVIANLPYNVGTNLLLKWLNRYDKKDIVFNIIYIILITLSVAVLWECVEFTIDKVLGMDTQKVLTTGVDDTMKDMICALIGSILYSIYYLYNLNKKK